MAHRGYPLRTEHDPFTFFGELSANITSSFLGNEGDLVASWYPPAVHRWTLEGENGIRWDVENDVHEDSLEMSGRSVSAIISYAVRGNRVSIKREVIWPTLRLLKDDVRGYLRTWIDEEDLSVWVDGKPLDLASLTSVHFDGRLRFEKSSGEVTFERMLCPAVELPLLIERVTLTNRTQREISVEWRSLALREEFSGFKGVYRMHRSWGPDGEVTLKPGESHSIWGEVAAWLGDDKIPIAMPDEEAKRIAKVTDVQDRLILETPDPILNRAFRFAKLRAVESIFDTQMGPVHSPGGGRYYGGIWANDQAEYSGPFFGLLGDPYAVGAAWNALRLFLEQTNPEFRPIPSSIEVEGDVEWSMGDRGDAAMVAWGASLFALSSGREDIARSVWPLVHWCLEYCRRQIDSTGVVRSDTDELEDRFESGSANLSTSCLAYAGFRYGARLARTLGIGSPNTMEREAQRIEEAIEAYFGADLEGFHTYRYCKGHDALRAWICQPLVVGILERKVGTLAALFSDRLWSPDGLATQSGVPTYWDRATLYALQGTFNAGEADLALKHLTAYTHQRLLGDHVPYPIEAYPEGNKAHLSAESALYCRIFTDGLLGIRPVSLHSFELRPHFPAEWSEVSLRKVRAYGAQFDLVVNRTPDGWAATVLEAHSSRSVAARWGDTVTIDVARL